MRMQYTLQSPLRVVVVSHDFPPNPSPQSMRIGRLVDGLLADGCEVQVLTGSYRPHWGPVLHEAATKPGLTVIRGLPNGIDRTIDALRALRRRWLPMRSGREASTSDGTLPQLNWKGRLVVQLKDVLSGLRYPGESRAWLSAVQPTLEGLLRTSSADCVVLSHEPPVGLMLHRVCRQAGIPMIAELGDPVCAPYTPDRWRGQALRLESQICRNADHVVVTCEATRLLLRQRHGIDATRITVLTQGFPVRASLDRSERAPSRESLRLVFTGRFYPFRDPGALLAAVGQVPGVELLIASGPNLGNSRTALPANVRVLGELPHADALRMQASAHVLVNIANEGLPQIPGKFFEYFAQPTPILHLSCSGPDEQAELLRKLQRGWSVANDVDAIVALLNDLLARHRAGQLSDGLDLSDASVEAFAWPQIGRRFAGIVRAAADSFRGRSPESGLLSLEHT